MTRLLLILALVCTGLAPGVTVVCAAAAQPAVDAACAMSCCDEVCGCVEDPSPDRAPVAPATPPRGSDVVSPMLWLASPLVLEWADDQGRQTPESVYTSARRGREFCAVQPVICRWQT